ncbi:hypothetical protein ACHAXT_010865 [Thalassiosira profunda]
MANSASSPGGSTGSSKRCKTSHDAVENISDLSGDALAAIAEYLPKTSRALLAVALTAPPSSWRDQGWRGQPSEAGRAILAASASSGGPFETVVKMACSELENSRTYKFYKEKLAGEKRLVQCRMVDYYGTNEGGSWEVLDFLDIEADLADKLTDDDIGATLACIDARSNLKKLHLTKCTSFVGEGLEPLRGSSALEQIDINIQTLIPSYSTSYKLDFSPQKAFTVLRSIWAAEGSSLRRLQMPPKWLTQKDDNTLFVEVLGGHSYSLNASTECCYFGPLREQIAVADRCKGCGGSDYTTCADCTILVCSNLDCENYDDVCTCIQCRKRSCCLCSNKGDASVKWCEMDECEECCEDCRYIACRERTNDCQFCKALVFDRMLQESTVQGAEMDRLRAEIAELRRAQESDNR